MKSRRVCAFRNKLLKIWIYKQDEWESKTLLKFVTLGEWAEFCGSVSPLSDERVHEIRCFIIWSHKIANTPVQIRVLHEIHKRTSKASCERTKRRIDEKSEPWCVINWHRKRRVSAASVSAKDTGIPVPTHNILGRFLLSQATEAEPRTRIKSWNQNAVFSAKKLLPCVVSRCGKLYLNCMVLQCFVAHATEIQEPLFCFWSFCTCRKQKGIFLRLMCGSYSARESLTCLDPSGIPVKSDRTSVPVKVKIRIPVLWGSVPALVSGRSSMRAFVHFAEGLTRKQVCQFHLVPVETLCSTATSQRPRPMQSVHYKQLILQKHLKPVETQLHSKNSLQTPSLAPQIQVVENKEKYSRLKLRQMSFFCAQGLSLYIEMILSSGSDQHPAADTAPPAALGRKNVAFGPGGLVCCQQLHSGVRTHAQPQRLSTLSNVLVSTVTVAQPPSLTWKMFSTSCSRSFQKNFELLFERSLPQSLSWHWNFLIVDVEHDLKS